MRSCSPAFDVGFSESGIGRLCVGSATGTSKANREQGCRHYKRRCRIVAPCCGEAFWCRHCHNEEKGQGRGAHEVDRTNIKEVVCQRCLWRQPPSHQCRSCNEVFAEYFCKTCNFWDDDGQKKNVFHCARCGICRVGGRENFFHCEVCGCCYPNEVRNSHICVENAMRQNCPVCLLDLFQSTSQVTILQCGHTIHQDCLRELQMSVAGLQSLRCPLCNSSLYKYEDLWAEMDRQVSETTMPPEYQNVQIGIICNDCLQQSFVNMHVVGHKCPNCGSYNTRRA